MQKQQSFCCRPSPTPILSKLEEFCSKWRIGINSEKTWALNFFKDSKNDNTPRLWLKNELIKYKTEFKFLGITFDEKLSFKSHIENIVSRCKKRLNLLKTIRGKDWSASPETILYTYKSFVRPVIEYGSILFANAEDKLLKKIQALETDAIKIAFRLPPWTTNFWCYQYVKFENILDRLKKQAKIFLKTNSDDELIKPLIESSKMSINGLHSAVYKTLNW